MNNEITEKTQVGGVFEFELVRDGKTIDVWKQENIVTNEGLDHMLDIHLDDKTRTTIWYIGLYSNTVTPLATHTYTSIGGTFTELSNTHYTPTVRPTWTPDAAGSVDGAFSNTEARATFTFITGATVSGALFVSHNVKGDATSNSAYVLFAGSAHSPARTVLTDDELLVKYSFAATSS